MAKYSKKAQEKVEQSMHEFKEGTLKSGKDGKGGKVKSREQAIAIGLSEARQEGAKAPKKASAKKQGEKARSKKTSPKKSTAKKATAKKAAKKAAPKKSGAKKSTKKTSTKSK
ncbi:MAG: putative histone H1-like protein [Bacteroidota bacterium]|jgi:hypothetical protein|nr:putative histone H1-like protein [Bacteroidota bacterium]